MKFPGESSERVARTLLAHGPATAAELADTLGLTPAGVRRLLATLVDAGLVAGHDRAPYGPSPKRGRGRPSQVYALTTEGRAACDQAYDDLALAALRFMADHYGPDAVAAFAMARADHLALAAGPGPLDPVTLAEALTGAGYAAEVTPLGELAVQLCQHHCPVVDAAREFPVLCEAETAALSRVLGRHVTRLATLANGDEVCTAVIPAAPGSLTPLPVVSVSRTTNRRVPA